MCGRYSLTTSPDVLAALFRLTTVPAYALRYNIAPTQAAPIVRIHSETGSRQLDMLRWGLVPSWAKQPDIGSRLINARSETAAEKPAFRHAFKRQRCLVPADAFYEWKKLPTGKQPYVLRLRDGQPFAFAGLWEQWRDSAQPHEPPLETFTILTTTANSVVVEVHDRMPVILNANDFDCWLDPSVKDAARLQSLLVPLASEAMVAYPVSRRVNSPAHDDPSCLEPLDASQAEGAPPPSSAASLFDSSQQSKPHPNVDNSGSANRQNLFD